MILVDCHTHTTNSPDGDNSVIEMCEKACSLGLSAYAITDHCETNRFYDINYYHTQQDENDDYNYSLSFEKSMQENTEAKELFKGKLNLICGIELGQATHDLETAEKIISDKRLDFVIGSIHEVPTYPDFAFMDYSKYNIHDLIQSYFEEVYKLCIWGKFDILGHLTYFLRYIEGNNGIKVDVSPYEEMIREIFKILIKNGKGIEINSSGLRQKYGKSFPTLDYIKLFHDFGGEVLSVGSDAHCTNDLFKGIVETIELAKAADFKYICYFKERKPNFIRID